MCQNEAVSGLKLLSPDPILQSAALAELPWVAHGFGTRSSSPWFGAKRMVGLRQIHSNQVVKVSENGPLAEEGDALITDIPGIFLSIRTADCLPILLADTRRHVVAAAHAGWRGTVSRIVSETVLAMNREFGAEPGDLTAVIGPGIAACCFEVGPEVARQFQSLFPERDDLEERCGIDLTEANRGLLLEAGVKAERIYTSGLCTASSRRLFHSFRRDKETAGRMLSMIGITG